MLEVKFHRARQDPAFGILALGNQIFNSIGMVNNRDILRNAYNTLLNNVSDRILRFNRELTCVYANFEFDNMPEGETPIVEGRSWDDLKPLVKPAKEWEAAVKKVFAKGERIAVEGARIGPSGDNATSLVFIPELGMGGGVTHVMAIAASAIPAGLPATGVAKLI